MRRMTLVGVALAALAGACVVPAENGKDTTPAAGETKGSFETERVHEQAQVSIWVPDHWKVDDGTDNLLVLADPNDEVGIMFVVVEAEDLLSSLLLVTDGVLSEVDDVRLTGDAEEANINGMEALFQDGTGVLDGVNVDLSVGVVLTPADKYLLVVGVAESWALEEHASTVLKIFQGLKPHRG